VSDTITAAGKSRVSFTRRRRDGESRHRSTGIGKCLDEARFGVARQAQHARAAGTARHGGETERGGATSCQRQRQLAATERRQLRQAFDTRGLGGLQCEGGALAVDDRDQAPPQIANGAIDPPQQTAVLRVDFGNAQTTASFCSAARLPTSHATSIAKE
jgi:hypothetical protein